MLNLPASLKTDRLLIQRLKYEDAEEIFYAYASKLAATKFVSWPTHQTVADTNQYLRKTISAWSDGLEFGYTIRTKHDNRLIGSIGAVNEEGKIQFGYIISPTHWNQGCATEACGALLHQLNRIEHISRIWTFIDAENVASKKVLLKLGLIEEALEKKWFRFVNQGDQWKDCILFHWPVQR